MVDRSGDTAQNQTNWRDKYLDALDSQELIEQQLELLRRSLVRVSVSADGQDDSLDKVLDHLREQLRKGKTLSNDELAALFNKVDHAVVSFEQQRKQTAQDVHQAIAEILRPFHNINLSRPLKKDVGHYLSQLSQRTEKIRLYPALLQQLATLQQQVFKEIHEPQAPTGLLQKLFGSPQTPDSSQQTAPTATPRDADDEIRENIPAAVAHQLDRQYQLEPARMAEPEQLVGNVSRVLHDLLSKVEVPESIGADAEIIRQRLAQGLTSDNLVPTLEHVRDLVMEAYLAANQAFANYLNNVNLELAEIYAVLGGALQSHATRREATQHLQDSMLQQVATLETNVASATELKQLKEQVKSQLGNIRQALDSFQHSEHEQQALTGQLQTLSDKIKTMEEDAERNRTTMERHRYKALHDPLTELPNREAYNERVEAEWQRWQRYNHPLTLAVCDLDHFKKINDNFGHQAGDRVLKVISRSIAKRLREVDFFGRYGGEEFVVIMPETSLDKAVAVLEKIRAAIANTAFNYKDEPLAITLSMGITEFKPGDTTESVFARADRALYKAKAAGRNRCQVAE